MDDYGFVYLWFDRRNKRFYIGSHWGSVHDRYICSSRWMRKAYRRRQGDFKRRILAIIATSRADLLIEEQRWLDMTKPDELKVRYYNVTRSVKATWHTEEEKRLTVAEKISRKLKGKRAGHGYSPEVRQAIQAGRKATFATRREQTGFAFTEETRRRISDSKRGLHHSDEHKAFMRSAIREARAANPTWDKVQDKTCVGCGDAFKGRASQKTCSRKCQANHWYRTKRSPHPLKWQ